MRARADRCVVVAVLGVLITGCGPDAPSNAEGSSAATTSSSPASSASPTTSAAPSTTATLTSGESVTYPKSQQDYTSVLVRAWGVGDQTRARRYATAAAVKKLFGTIDRGGPGWTLVGCDNAGPQPACTFIDRGQGQRLVILYDAYKLGQPRAVLDLEFISDNPTLATQ